MNKYKTLLASIVIIMLLASCNRAEYAKHYQDLKSFSLIWGKYEREYWVYAPQQINPARKLPLLFVLHGGGGTAKNTPGLSFGRFNELADQHQFIVVYPQGIEKQWNDGRKGNQTKAWRENIDDVGFLGEVANRLKQAYRIDSEKVFTTGMSNGGFMSSRLLCDRSDVFRAGAIVTATISEEYFPKCKPENPVGVLVMNGTADKLVPYEGGEVKVLGSKRGQILSTDRFIEFWTQHNGCTQTHTMIELPDSENDGTTVTKQMFSACKTGGSVVLYKIKDGGHTWPGGMQYLGEGMIGKTNRDINACDEIWQFFESL